MPKSNAESCRDYRRRKKEGYKLIKNVSAIPKKKINNAQYCRMYRLRKKLRAQGNLSAMNQFLNTTSSPNSSMTLGASPLLVTTDSTSTGTHYSRDYIIVKAEANTNSSPAEYHNPTTSRNIPEVKEQNVGPGLRKSKRIESKKSNTYCTIGTENITIELKECTEEELNIKQEIEDELEIKSEVESHEDMEDSATDNPFRNLQVYVKQEIPTSDEEATNTQIEVVPKRITLAKSVNVIKKDKKSIPKGLNMIKQEDNHEIGTCDDVISYDYPNFDDSMDSNEAVALSNVEVCLQDDNVKSETHGNTVGAQNFYNVIKNKSDIPIAETHLISNKRKNTTSTITNPRDGIKESQTNKTLAKEIRPMDETAIPLKPGNPEEILPTNDSYTDCDDTFQLNSITGNVLSLEQQVYGLLQKKSDKHLKAKKYMCNKCPNAYTRNAQLQKHLRVHDSIEERPIGFSKGVRC